MKRFAPVIILMLSFSLLSAHCEREYDEKTLPDYITGTYYVNYAPPPAGAAAEGPESPGVEEEPDRAELLVLKESHFLVRFMLRYRSGEYSNGIAFDLPGIRLSIDNDVISFSQEFSGTVYYEGQTFEEAYISLDGWFSRSHSASGRIYPDRYVFMKLKVDPAGEDEPFELEIKDYRLL